MQGKLGYKHAQDLDYKNQKWYKQVRIVESDNDEFKVKRIALGDFHAMALTRAGLVYVWGGHLKGKRGDDPAQRKKINGAPQYYLPTLIKSLTSIKEISCG